MLLIGFDHVGRLGFGCSSGGNYYRILTVSAQEQEKEKKPEEAETNSERQTENTAEVMRPERRNIDIKEVRHG